MAEHKIPAKQLHRSVSSKEALTRLLDDCEMGYCTSDKGVYIKHNGELIPVRGEEMSEQEVGDIVNLCT